MKKKHLMLVVGLGITVAALWWSTRGIKLADFIQAFREMNYLWLVPAFIAFYFSMYLRGVRWGLLFRPHHHFNGRQMFSPTMICFGFNSIFPARVGEVARAYYVGRRMGTGIPTALATVVAERVLDGITLMGFLGFSLWMLPPLDPHLSITFGKSTIDAPLINKCIHNLTILSIVMTAGLIVFMIPLTQQVMLAIIRRLPLAEKIKQSITHLFQQFAQGFHALHQPAVLARIVIHSLLIWGLVAWSNQMVGKGFGLPISLAQGAALMTLIGIAIMVPATPGYWGPYEAGAQFSLLMMGVCAQDPAGRSKALAFALVLHLLQYLPIVVIGMYCAWRAQLRPDEVGATGADATAKTETVAGE